MSDEARVRHSERMLRSMGVGSDSSSTAKRSSGQRRGRRADEREHDPYAIDTTTVTLEPGTRGAFSAYVVTERFAYVSTALSAPETIKALRETHAGKWKLLKHHRRYPDPISPRTHQLLTYERMP